MDPEVGSLRGVTLYRVLYIYIIDVDFSLPMQYTFEVGSVVGATCKIPMTSLDPPPPQPTVSMDRHKRQIVYTYDWGTNIRLDGQTLDTCS